MSQRGAKVEYQRQRKASLLITEQAAAEKNRELAVFQILSDRPENGVILAETRRGRPPKNH